MLLVVTLYERYLLNTEQPCEKDEKTIVQSSERYISYNSRPLRLTIFSTPSTLPYGGNLSLSTTFSLPSRSLATESPSSSLNSRLLLQFFHFFLLFQTRITIKIAFYRFNFKSFVHVFSVFPTSCQL